eukprot:TRINITY_DN1162_c0_g8_i1.p1 TRINITY_DN1162_c0_g8~~TRINITY_DN1162_c0_g8_i1.p1  ORF type:complete len:128 (+),score=24.15 TRINITY_DN1162_c0_g8_i1:81-464(+)
MVDRVTKESVAKIPLLKVNAGPRDGEKWTQRLKEEYTALIKYIQINKSKDNDWFHLESDKTGTKWFGRCWYIYEMKKFEFQLRFEIPVTYPVTNPEIELPELEGKTEKMYRYVQYDDHLLECVEWVM